MSRIEMHAVSGLELNGIDLSGYLAGDQPDLGTFEILDGLPDASMAFDAYWDAPLPGLTDCSMTIVVPGWMTRGRAWKNLQLFLDPVGYRRRSRMRTAYHRRKR